MPAATRNRPATPASASLTDWESWSAHLLRRTAPAAPWQHLPGNRWPLNWALETSGVSTETRQMLSRLERWSARTPPTAPAPQIPRWQAWREQAGERSREAGFGLECVAWAYLLPGMAPGLTEQAWWAAYQFLQQLARSGAGREVQREPLAHQWLASELPLTLAYQFPECEHSRSLAKVAQQGLTDGFDALLDLNGLPAAEHVGSVRPLLASWTRVATLAQAGGIKLFSRAMQERFVAFLRCAVQLTRETGAPCFGEEAYHPGDRALFDKALEFAAEDQRVIAEQLLPQRRGQGKREVTATLLPSPAINSEWGRVAILRTDWLSGSPQWVLAHQAGQMRCELLLGGRPLCSGPWEQEIRIDKRKLPPPDSWVEVCWHSDDDLDYQELQAELAGGWILQRQVLLAREDRFLFLADALLGKQDAQIEYRSSLPLAAGVRFRSTKETWDGQLAGRHGTGLVLPLALPEWRAAPQVGSLHTERGQLVVTHTAAGPRTYLPLFVDLNAERTKRKRTWRRLTVAEKLEIQPDTVATAYRVQVADEQWLFYRSLAAAGNRTVLGQNLNNEFLAARFDRDGETEELIRIDSD